ncbi:MAG: hypothetical protein U5K32_12330 [Bacteroidales bacterium]|nr:hypothetical protein [Bacteroidales bacterium]
MKNYSTLFIDYKNIDTSAIDLYADAWGFEYCLSEQLSTILIPDIEPCDRVISDLLRNIDKMADFID